MSRIDEAKVELDRAADGLIKALADNKLFGEINEDMKYIKSSLSNTVGAFKDLKDQLGDKYTLEHLIVRAMGRAKTKGDVTAKTVEEAAKVLGVNYRAGVPVPPAAPAAPARGRAPLNTGGASSAEILRQARENLKKNENKRAMTLDKEGNRRSSTALSTHTGPAAHPLTAASQRSHSAGSLNRVSAPRVQSSSDSSSTSSKSSKSSKKSSRAGSVAAPTAMTPRASVTGPIAPPRPANIDDLLAGPTTRRSAVAGPSSPRGVVERSASPVRASTAARPASPARIPAPPAPPAAPRAPAVAGPSGAPNRANLLAEIERGKALKKVDQNPGKDEKKPAEAPRAVNPMMDAIASAMAIRRGAMEGKNMTDESKKDGRMSKGKK